MKIQIDKIEKIITRMLHTDCQAQVTKLFSDYKQDKIGTFMLGMNTFTYFSNHENRDVSSGTVMGFIAGVLMSDLSQVEEYQKVLFDDVIERLGRNQGENVVDFLGAKVDRRQ